MSDSNQYLPPRMRRSKQKSGNVYYYYDTCGKDRKWLPLGADYVEALRQYADLEKSFSSQVIDSIEDNTTFAYVAARYFKEVVPNKAVSTQKCNARELKNLLEFFNDPPIPINAVQPVHIVEYLRWRESAKTRANREVALLSHIFNCARMWGYTANANPVAGVKKYHEKGRDVYVSDDLFKRVFEKADRHIQNFILISYLTGQRVADNMKIQLSDIVDGVLWVQQNKTGTRLRVRLTGSIKELVDDIIQTRGELTHDYLFTNKRGLPLTYDMLRYGIDKARRRAGVDKKDFQSRDLRAKSGTDKEDSHGMDAAQALLGHSSSAMTKKYIRNRKGKLVDPTVIQLRGE